MIVVADASPLIFLGKVRRLDLLQTVLGTELHVPESVYEELFLPTVDPAEAEYLACLLKTCTVDAVRQPRRFALAMSRADNDALTLALRLKAEFLLCDDRITRLAAETEGIRPLGTLGLLLRAVRKKVMSPSDARDCLDCLVRMHGFRIGIELYRDVLAEIEAAKGQTF
jgi:predicted nucleic acid-binding protein